MKLNSPLVRAIGIVVVLILLIVAVVAMMGARTQIKLVRPLTAIGTASTVAVEVDAPHGVKAFSAALEQNGQTAPVYQDHTKTRQQQGVYTFQAGSKAASFLKEGTARLLIKAKSNDLWGATTDFSQDVQVILRPPTVVADGRQHYINQGGAELVTIDVGGNWSEAGVHVANYSAGSFAMPGEPDSSAHRFSLFPYPWDVATDTVPLAFARNAGGTEVTTSFWVKVFPKKFRESTINVNERNLQKVVGELDPNGSGSLVDRFLKLNREMRRSNGQTIYDLRNNTEHRILWSGAFVPVKGARESFFADKRTYVYNGQKIDEQVHLGYDLAQTMNSPVKAANAGKVIFADRLGLYGNCVIIDHGYTLQSLYGHMSRIIVKVGDMVQKEQQIGISGATGMAFGDHVHFSMMIAGIQVDPKEWWDEHWIHDRILSKIGPQEAGKAESASSATPMGSEPSPKAAHKHHKKR